MCSDHANVSANQRGEPEPGRARRAKQGRVKAPRAQMYGKQSSSLISRHEKRPCLHSPLTHTHTPNLAPVWHLRGHHQTSHQLTLCFSNNQKKTNLKNTLSVHYSYNRNSYSWNGHFLGSVFNILMQQVILQQVTFFNVKEADIKWWKKPKTVLKSYQI